MQPKAFDAIVITALYKEASEVANAATLRGAGVHAWTACPWLTRLTSISILGQKGKPRRALLACSGFAGNVLAAIRTTQLLDIASDYMDSVPRYVVLIGITGTVPKGGRPRHGDVIIGDALNELDIGKKGPTAKCVGEMRG